MQRHLRLRRNADFQRLRKVGKTRAHPYLVLSTAANDLLHNRYGIVTSRRLGNAVVRNRAKRRIREAVRYWHPQIVPGYDIVFIVRQQMLHASYPELLEAVRVLLQRAGLFVSVVESEVEE